AMPLALALPFTFSPPAWLEGRALFAWMLFSFLLVAVSFSCFVIPYHALGAELTDDVHERTTLVAVRSAFGCAGTIAAGAYPLLAARFGSPRVGYAVVAVLGGIVTLGCTIGSFAAARERATSLPPVSQKTHLLRSLRGALRDRPLFRLIVTFVVTSIGG